MRWWLASVLKEDSLAECHARERSRLPNITTVGAHFEVTNSGR